MSRFSDGHSEDFVVEYQEWNNVLESVSMCSYSDCSEIPALRWLIFQFKMYNNLQQNLDGMALLNLSINIFVIAYTNSCYCIGSFQLFSILLFIWILAVYVLQVSTTKQNWCHHNSIHHLHCSLPAVHLFTTLISWISVSTLTGNPVRMCVYVYTER